MMHYMSERGDISAVSFAQAVENGLAADGGLYVPQQLPRLELEWCEDYAAFAAQCLFPFCEPSFSSDELAELCRRAFDFPLLMRGVTNDVWMMELFHGPTAAFKDFGARFLAQVMAALPAEKERLILVATSGDTGSAVASAFFRQPNTKVVVLYPDGMVSARQAHQLSCWGENIVTLAVDGTFDDCQHLVKSLLQRKDVAERFDLSTANSISIGRLLPQLVYYAYASLWFQHNYGERISFVVPSGNLGNVTAAFWARAAGLPIDRVVLAQNANKTVVDYMQTGDFKPSETINTLANAMDVGNPSNFMRLKYLFGDLNEFRRHVLAYSIDDEAIKKAIFDAYRDHGLFICPHTAAAYSVVQQLDAGPWMMAATADACKFEQVVEPVVGCEVPLLPVIQEQLSRPEHQHHVPASMDAVLQYV